MDKPSSPPLSTWLPIEGLVVLAAASSTAWLASLPIIFAPGILAYLILVGLRLRRFREAAEGPSTEPLRPEYAARVGRCVALQTQILTEIRNADAEHRAMLAPSEERVRGLARAARELAARLQKIDAHLGAEDREHAAREAQAIELRIAETHDPAARASLSRALEQHGQRARVIEELRARREQGDAQLTHLELTLETVAAQILRIESADPFAILEGRGRVVESLDALSVEVDAAAEAIDVIAAR